MKKIIKNKLLIVFAVLCLISTINATGIAAKTETPKPVIDLSGSGISDTESSVQEDARKTPAPFDEHDDSYVPIPTKSAITEEEVDTDSGASDDEFMPGEIIVGFKDEYSVSRIAKLIPNIKIVKIKDIYESVYNSAIQNYSVDAAKLKSVKEEIGKYFVVTISDKSKKAVLKIIKALKKVPIVKYAEPNYICKPGGVPNDYNNYNLWNMSRIQMPQTWNSYPGKSIKVGVLDTGIDAKHPDLKNNVVTSLGWNCARKSNTDTLDYSGHGTHVAGTIGAEGNNSIGVVGVNPLARLVPIKICFSNTNNSSNAELMAEGILHATKNSIPVCNMSYSIPDSSVFRDAVKKYGQNGGTFVVAAYNDGICVDNVQAYKSLAELDNVIMVANSRENDEINPKSNYGNIVHVAAPGTNIWSTFPTAINASGYISYSGTSMAAPHVTGVVSLLKGINPDMNPYMIRQIIMNCADPVPELRGKVSSSGRLNAKNSVDAYLCVTPNSNETMAAAIKRSLGSRSGSGIKMMGLKGAYGLADGNDSSDSASAILPNLKVVDMSSFTGSLGTYAFSDCRNLETVIRGSALTKIPAQCFMNCTKLTTIVENNKSPKITNEIDLTDLTGDIAIDTQAFEGCTKLTTIKFPSRLIGSARSFSNCIRLSTIYKDGDIKQAGTFDLTGVSNFWRGWGHNFENTDVRTVKLPKGVNISEYCFYNCIKLKKILFERTQTNTIGIGSHAFYGVNPDCKAYMNLALVNLNKFQIKQGDIWYIPKVAY